MYLGLPVQTRECNGEKELLHKDLIEHARHCSKSPFSEGSSHPALL